MLTRPEAADPAVQELKRRARRRLVGAVVLALAAAVILPLLLESDPKPLGDDVSIQIPPIDNGRFITPLSPAKGTDAKAKDRAVAPPSPPPRPVAAAPDAPMDAKPANADTAGGKAGEPMQAPATETDAPPARASALVTPEVKPNLEPQKSAAAPAPKAGSGDARPSEVAPLAGGFVVQLAALADAKAAAALASKLKSSGFPAYTETLKTQQGTVRRVRVGPYATREAADAQLAKVNAAGFRGVVAAK